MAISSFFGLNTALRGLVAHQRALDVTGHNIANASTEGYSRQSAVLAAATHCSSGPDSGPGSGWRMRTLTGREVMTIESIRDLTKEP